MTGPYGFWWTLCVVILCLATWQTGRAIFRHGQSQPDQARHPSSTPGGIIPSSADLTPQQAADFRAALGRAMMPDLDGAAMPWPPPRSLLYFRAVPGGFEMACDCGTVTGIEIIARCDHWAAQEIAVTCGGCTTVHWITITPTKEQA